MKRKEEKILATEKFLGNFLAGKHIIVNYIYIVVVFIPISLVMIMFETEMIVMYFVAVLYVVTSPFWLVKVYSHSFFRAIEYLSELSKVKQL